MTISKGVRRAIKIALLAVAGLFAIAVLVLVGLATPPGRAVLASIVERVASGNGLTVSITGLSGWPPFRFGADRIVLSDGKGAFAEIDGMHATLASGALLSGQVSVTSLTADRIAVARPPALASSGTASDGALLPFAVERLHVARLELGAGLVGKPAVLDLAGGVSTDSGGAINAALVANRIDGPSGSLSAKVTQASVDAPLILDLTAAEAANGILLGAMGRTDGPGYRLTGKATYAIDGALAGTVSLASEGAAHFDGTFDIDPAGSLKIDGRGDLAELVPPAYADLLGGTIAGDAAATWAFDPDGTPRVTIETGAFSSSSVRASLSGTYGDANTGLALRVDAASPGGGAINLPIGDAGTVHISSLSVSGKVQPKGSGIRFDLVGHVADLAAGPVSAPGIGLSLAIEADDKNPLAAASLPFALRVEADALNLPAGRIAASGEAPLLFTADGALDPADKKADVKAVLAAAGGRATFTGTLAADHGEGELAAAFADLAALSPVAGETLAGGLSANAKGTFYGADGQKLAIAGTSSDLVIGNLLPKRFLSGSVVFGATASHGSDRRIALSGLSVKSTALAAGGDLSLAGETIDGRISGEIADLSIVADGSSGAATFEATLGGSTTAPKIDATVKAAAGTLFGQSIKNTVVQISGAPETGGWRGAIALDGSFAGRPLAGKADAMLDPRTGALTFPAVDLTIAGNRASGALAQTAGGLFTGTLDIDATNLTPLSAFLDVKVVGSARANLKLGPSNGTQGVGVSFTGTRFAIEDIPVGRMDGQLRIADAFGKPLVDGTITASAVDFGGVSFEAASIKAIAENGTTRFEVAARGPDLNLSGRTHIVDIQGNPALAVDALTGTAFNLPIQLLPGPATVGLGRNTQIANANFAFGGGRATLDGLAAPQLDLRVVAANLPASVIERLSPGLGAEGTINGKVSIVGNHNTKVTWEASWANFGVASTRSAGLPGLSLVANGIAIHGATSVSARLSGAGLALTLAGNVPYRGDRLQLRVTGTAPLELAALLSAQELRLGGTAALDLNVGGTLKAPLATGTIDLANATAADALSGVGISGASGRIRINGQSATIERLAGKLTQGGSLSVTGSVTIDPAAGLPANLSLQVSNGRYIDGTTINAAFNASLRVQGPLAGSALISGQVDLGRTEILLPDKFGGPATALDVHHVNTAPGFVPPVKPAPPETTGNTASSAFRLDLQVSNRGGIFVRGFGLDAELGGSLRVRGTVSDPVAVGAFNLTRGRLDLVGHRFDISKGELTFSGDLIPVVDFEATNTGTTATVNVLVTGPANDPKIEFTSSPALPQEEVLAQLFFGTSVGKLSPFQAVQLLDSVGQLSGVVARGDGLFDRVRRATGLDDLDIRQNQTGGTIVGVGRAIGDNLRVGVEQDTQAGKGKVTVDLDIAKNLKARGEAGGDGSGQLGLTYEHEY